MAKAKALKKLAEKVKTKKKKEKVLSKKTQARNKDIEKSAKVLGYKSGRSGYAIGAALPELQYGKKGAAAIKKAIKRITSGDTRSARITDAKGNEYIIKKVDSSLVARQSKPKKKYTGGIVRKQAGGFVHRRNQRRQG